MMMRFVLLPDFLVSLAVTSTWSGPFAETHRLPGSASPPDGIALLGEGSRALLGVFGSQHAPVRLDLT